MSRIRFDQLAKQYLEAFLEPLGQVQRNLEVPGESKFVDVWFTPTTPQPTSDIDMGLLHRLAFAPCLLEPSRNAPTRQEVRSCLLKLLWLQEDQRRKLEQEGRTQSETVLPRLWILAATVTRPVVADFGGALQADWLSGMYFLPEGLKTAIVAIDQLPSTSETLWLRILGRGETQQRAIAELLVLPTDDLRRSRVLELLVNWRITLEITEEINEEGRELMAVLSQAYLEWEQKTKQEGRQEGWQEGRQEEGRSLVLRLLTRQVGDVSEATRSQIEAFSLDQLESLGEALLEFETIADLEVWLQRDRAS